MLIFQKKTLGLLTILTNDEDRGFEDPIKYDLT